MSPTASPYDNAQAESFIKTLIFKSSTQKTAKVAMARKLAFFLALS